MTLKSFLRFKKTMLHRDSIILEENPNVGKSMYNGRMRTLLESEEVLSSFEKSFPKEIVRANPKERPFEASETNLRKIFSVLNGLVFENKVGSIDMFLGNNKEIVTFLKERFDKDVSEVDVSNYLGFHVFVPIEETVKHRYKLPSDQTIVFNTSYGKSSFGYAVSLICHEMIHNYDFHFGEALKYSYANKQYNLGINLHYTPTFRRFMKEIPEKYDIPIFVDGDGRPYIELNEEAQKYFLSLKEELCKESCMTSDSKSQNTAIIEQRNDGSTFIMDVIRLDPTKP